MLSRNKEIRVNTQRISRLLVRSEQKFDLRIKFHFRRSDLRSDLRSDWLVCLEFQGLSLINALRTLNFAKENCNRHEALFILERCLLLVHKRLTIQTTNAIKDVANGGQVF